MYKCKSLLVYSSKILYFKILNILLQIQYNGYYYCFCDIFYGCKGDYPQRTLLCFLCQINFDYDTDDTEELKYDSVKLIRYALNFFEFKQCINLVPGIWKCWSDEYECK